MTERPRISACVITHDEADRIADCLASLDFCDELLVVDSHSADATREIAAARGARVLEHDFAGFGPQKEYAARAARHDWVLQLDADERVSAELRAEILALRDAGFPGHAGWSMPRLSSYFGTWVRHGTWYPNRVLRLYDRRRGRWSGDPPHEKVALEGSAGRLAGDLHHFPYRSVEEHLRTIDRYTTTMAEDLYRRGRRAGVGDLVVRPAWRFLRFYVVKRGFLLGWKGLWLAQCAAMYVRVKYVKLRVLQGQGEGESASPRARRGEPGARGAP